jgi:predicted RNA polymerase sigma factor
MATGPAAALAIVDGLATRGALRGTHLLPSVRGELLVRLGRAGEARSEFITAAGLARNQRTRDLLEERAAGISPAPGT